MNIFIVGFMGAGKTTLGRQLAQLLGYGFIDTDTLIEEQNNTTIARYFETFGETAFRNKETEALHSIAHIENHIVATGGGLPCFNSNMQWMNRRGITIYIKQTANELTYRLKNTENERPLINNIPDDALKPYIASLLEKRTPFYEAAKYTFKGPFVSPETVINTVVSEC